MKKKKRNPQDATLRNIRALKKRVDALEVMLESMIKWMSRSAGKR